MAKRKKNSYDKIHEFVERVEDVLLSESSWSTSDTDCSGCLHLSKGSITQSESDGDTGDLELSTLSSSISHLNKERRTHLKQKALNSGKTKLFSESSNIIDSISASGVHHSSGSTILSNTAGGMLQQLSLLTAGAQPWNYNICAVHHRKFAYAATLVIYVYQVEGEGSEWELCSILADHRKTITCIHWHPTSDDILASSSMDQCICIWSISRQCVLQAINICKVPILVSWCYGVRDILSFTTLTGPIQVWNYTADTEPCSFREEHGYSSNIVTYAWHPSIARRLIVGHADGRLTLYREDTNKVKYSFLLEGLDDGECHPVKIKTIAWDYNSPDYLLIAYHEGQLWLADVSSFKIVTKFLLPGSSSVATVAWLPDAPGMFVTGDSEKGVLRIWSVAKNTPLENCCLKDTGFHCLAIPLLNYSSSHTAVAETNDSVSLLEEKGPVIPQVSVLTLFIDGGIGIYHIKRKEWVFNREHGHTETIFDCSFKPEDSDLLATGSFDGSIKIWRVDTMETVQTLPNRGTIIYSISWAPADLNCIAAGTSSGEVFIWNISKHKIIQEFKMHKDKKVYCVAWNMNDSRKIASVGESCYCFVHEVSGVNGLLVQSYKHPSPVYGCHWRDEDILATGCEDGKIRVYSVNKSSKEPVLELKAHQQKVFGVRWNPVYRDILCSGSDDTTIKIWSFSRAQCLSVLIGHSDNIRGLVWCPEVPSLLISGSWDRTMRVWDARSCTCLDIVFDHKADIYGLSIHPLRPFLLASCSRDSTVRLWSLSSLVNPLQLKVLAGRPLEEIIGEKNPNGTFDPNMRLCGLRAEHLLSVVNKIEPTQKESRSLKMFADLFCADVRIRNLWDLVCVLLGVTDITSLSPQYHSSIVHHSHLMKCALATANEMEMTLSKAKGVTNLRTLAIDTHESLANIYLSYGALQQYCELMVKLSKWDLALALAPAVSVDYWKLLMERHGNQLLADDNEACIPYLLASKDTDKLIQFYVMRGHLDKALSSCMAVSKSRFNLRKGSVPIPPAIPPRNNKLDLQADEVVLNDRIIDCAQRVANWHIRKGSPISAACSLLSVDNIEGAMRALLKGHEIDLTVVLGHLLKGKKSLSEAKKFAIENVSNIAKRYLVYRAIKIASSELALDLAKSVLEEEERTLLLAEVVISFSSNFKERERIQGEAGFPSPSECDKISHANSYEEILYALLSTQLQQGLCRGIELLKECVVNNDYSLPTIWHILRLLQSVPLCPSSNGTLNAKIEQKAMLLSYSAFFGAIKASVLGYYTVVVALLDHSMLLIEKYNPSEMENVRKEIHLLKSKYDSGDMSLGLDLCGLSNNWMDTTGLTRVCGSHLPRHSDNHVCCISRQIIKGPGYFLEDDVSVVSLNDALMWAKVHPFSPLGTGSRLNPF